MVPPRRAARLFRFPRHMGGLAAVMLGELDDLSVAVRQAQAPPLERLAVSTCDMRLGTHLRGVPRHIIQELEVAVLCRRMGDDRPLQCRMAHGRARHSVAESPARHTMCAPHGGAAGGVRSRRRHDTPSPRNPPLVRGGRQRCVPPPNEQAHALSGHAPRPTSVRCAPLRATGRSADERVRCTSVVSTHRNPLQYSAR